MFLRQGKKQLVSQVLWPLSNISALCYIIDQCLIPLGFILNGKRVIENIEVNSQLRILEDGHSHGHTHTHCIYKLVSMYSSRVTFTWNFKLITKVFIDIS